MQRAGSSGASGCFRLPPPEAVCRLREEKGDEWALWSLPALAELTPELAEESPELWRLRSLPDFGRQETIRGGFWCCFGCCCCCCCCCCGCCF